MYLSLSKAAAYLDYSPSTLRRLIDRGKLVAYRATPTSQIKLKQSDLDALMERKQRAETEAHDFWALFDQLKPNRKKQHELH